MTEFTQPLSTPAWEDAAGAVVCAARVAGRNILCGVGLGLTGLAVVMTVTSLLIGVHEFTATGLPSLLPPEIRFQ